MLATEEQIRSKLIDVMDPELHLSIIDLGLVYEIQQPTEKEVIVRMTLTTIGCPLFDVIQDEVKTKMAELGYEEQNVKVDLTFDPPWSMEKMTERAKAMLGI